MFRKVLVANRGEIAVRILRTLREMGIASVAVYSDADRNAVHVRRADEARRIGSASLADSYLNVDAIVRAARDTGAEALHPGYGFLSEAPELAARCEESGITFIGPPVSAIRDMGEKTAARARMQQAGVPVVPGGDAGSVEEARWTATELGYPIMLKAAAGGGGKGIRLVLDERELPAAFERAQSEAIKSFGDGKLYVEKAIVGARHVEVQVLGDRFGNVVHLFERDCSIQRRHQKVLEETPSPGLPEKTMQAMGQVAVAGARAVSYYSAGTFEFLVSPLGDFYFLEMNTRLQVEHPITELITGLDLVREMIRVAAGEPLGYSQADLVRRGAAIECRVYAEDPSAGFLPSPGTITLLRTPSGPGVRDDSGVELGSTITPDFDPLISKLCVWAPTRSQALARMARALSEYAVGGLRTNLTLHQNLLRHPEFVAGRYDTDSLGVWLNELAQPASSVREQQLLAAAAVLFVQRRSEARAAPSGQTSAWLQAHRSRLRPA